jgi:hypothetical protein
MYMMDYRLWFMWSRTRLSPPHLPVTHLSVRMQIYFTCLAREPFLLRESGSGTRIAADRLYSTHGL